MEAAIYDLVVGETRRGRVFLSVLPNLKLRLLVAYPDDTHSQVEAWTPRDLVVQFQAVMKDKFGDVQVFLATGNAAEVQKFQQLFQQGRYELEKIFSQKSA